MKSLHDPMGPATLLCALILLMGASAQEGATSELVWRVPKACGANCVYILAKMAAVQASYPDVLKVVRVDDSGTSLQELEAGCRKLGLRYRAVRGRPSLLLPDRMPLVAHLDHWTGASSELGHFVVLLEYDEVGNVAEFLDPITVLRHKVPVDDFRRQWSGFALVPESPSGATIWSWIGFGLVGVWIAMLCVGWRRRRAPANPVPAEAHQEMIA